MHHCAKNACTGTPWEMMSNMIGPNAPKPFAPITIVFTRPILSLSFPNNGKGIVTPNKSAHAFIQNALG